MGDSISAEDFIENTLAHADRVRVYDPQKAHEYYLRNRKLKGRKPKGDSVEAVTPGRPSKAVVTRREKISNATARATKGVSPERAAKITALSNQAKEKLTKISKELEQWSADFEKKATNQSEKIARETKQKIEALPLLPRNAGPALREQRKKNLAKIRADGDTRQTQLKSSNRKAVEQKRLEIQSTKKQVVDDLRAAVRKVSNTTNDRSSKVTLDNGTGR